MRRSVDRLTTNRRTALGRGLAMVALLAGESVAGDGDVPDLTQPSEMPIVSKPATPATVPLPARPPGRAMLAIPGLTTPTTRPSIPLEGPKSPLETLQPELSLDAPIEMKAVPDSTRVIPGAPTSRSSRPLVLESSPMDEPAPLGSSTIRTNPSAKRPSTPPQPVHAPARRGRFFGLLPAQQPVASSNVPAASKTGTPGRSVAADDLRDDPAPESALKRRIERQAREAVGNRARSVEVKVSGKDAVVHVGGVKFLQKRAVRKQLEGLPALSGLRSTIEVED